MLKYLTYKHTYRNLVAMNEQGIKKAAPVADMIGVALSVLCLVHCMGTSLLVAFFPALGFGHGESSVHVALAFVIIAVALVAFQRGYARHKNSLCFGAGIVGLALVLFALFIPFATATAHGHSHDHGMSTQDILTSIGGVILIMAHYWNIRGSRCECATCG